MGPRANRRRSYRAGVQGCAIVHAPRGVAPHCAVLDLGLGGVRLMQLDDTDPPLPDDTPVAVELECAGAGWVMQRGRVLRHRGAELVIRFDVLAPEVEDLIEEEILGALEAEREPRIVVVDAAEARRRWVADALRARGFCALEAATPLEAIELVECSRNHVRAVALSSSLTQTQSCELISYLRDEHPEIRIAQIEEGAVQKLARLRH